LLNLNPFTGGQFVPAANPAKPASMTRGDVFAIVRDQLSDILEIDPLTISEGQSFVDDLDADSLALIELVEGLEEEFAERSIAFRIEDEDLVDMKTVRDAVDYVYDRVKSD
jgi:acyl carrier protein